MVVAPTQLTALRTLALMLVALVAGFVLGRGGRPSGISNFCGRGDWVEAVGGERTYLYVAFDVKPERREEFLTTVRQNEAGTLGTEPLNRAYMWGEDIEVPNRFHFHEEYVGTAGFDEHLKTPHVKVWDAFVDTDPFVGGKEKGVMGPYKYYAASPAPKEYIGKFQN